MLAQKPSFVVDRTASDSATSTHALSTPSSSAIAKMDRNRILSRRMVEGKIAEGHVIVIFEGQILNLDGWIEKHPGGRLPLLHMVGYDASSEIAA